MTKRQQALERIRIECAKEGRVTQFALRHYVENRISMVAFREACNRGLAQHKGN